MKDFEVRRIRRKGRFVYAVYNASTNERESGFYTGRPLAESYCDTLNRQLKKREATTKRKCMCCGQTFLSEGIHNRLCRNCGHSGLGKEMIDPCTLQR